VSRDDVINVERLVNAPPERIFDLLADPSKHPEFDGSDSVRASRDGNPARLSLGAEFSMRMHVGIPYRVTNHVIEFEEGRRIAWWHWARNVWRFDLQPMAGATLVRESFDATRGRGTWLLHRTSTFERNRKAMESTLERIAWLTEGKGAHATGG
jgi:uncharacterized protein YndB with AHSA1/START domain